MVRPTCLIFNDKAGTAASVKDLFEQLIDTSLCEFHVTRGADDTRNLARLAVQRGVRRIIAAGGDGTVSQAVNGIAPDFHRVELAVVPLGTGNDFARSLGVPLDNLAGALSLALRGHSIPLDLIRVRDEGQCYLVNAASGGFGGRVAADVSRLDKARWGPFAYWMTAMADWGGMQAAHVHCEVDSVPHDLAIYGLAVTNGRYVGGGFPIARQASLNDGRLDLTIIPALPTLELLAAGVNYMLGVSSSAARIMSFQARKVTLSAEPDLLFSLDGEPRREVTASFEIMPRASRVVIGRQPVAISSTATAEDWVTRSAEGVVFPTPEPG